MFRSMPLSGSLAACLMIYGPHMPTKMCKQNLHSGWQNGNRIKRKREQPERLLSLFMYASFSWGHGVWNLAEWVRHWGNRSVRISGNKQIIRTHFPRGKSGSDYIGLVPVVGLEPTRYLYQRILSPPRLPFQHTGKGDINTLKHNQTKDLGGMCRRDIKLTYYIVHEKRLISNNFFGDGDISRSAF